MISATVFLLTTGDGSDGDEWHVISVHSTEDGAKQAKAAYEAPRPRSDGTTYTLDATVEPWDLLP